MQEMEVKTPFVTSFYVFFRQIVEQKCVVIEYCTYPSPTSMKGNMGGLHTPPKRCTQLYLGVRDHSRMSLLVSPHSGMVSDKTAPALPSHHPGRRERRLSQRQARASCIHWGRRQCYPLPERTGELLFQAQYARSWHEVQGSKFTISLWYVSACFASTFSTINSSQKTGSRC